MTSLKELQGVMVLLGVNIRIGPSLKYGQVYDQSDLPETSMNIVKDEVEVVDTDDTCEVFGHSDGDTPTKHQKKKKPSVVKKSSASVKFKQCGLLKDFKVNIVRCDAYEGNNNEKEGPVLSENERYGNKCGIEDNIQQNDRHESSENKHRSKKDSKRLKSSQKSFSNELDVLSEIAEGHEFEQPVLDVTDKIATENLIETETPPSKRKRSVHYAENTMSLKKVMMILKPNKVKNRNKRMDTSHTSQAGFSSKRLKYNWWVKNCKSCVGCLRDDCGECKNCRDKKKFGGSDKKRQKCVQRKCRMSIL